MSTGANRADEPTSALPPGGGGAPMRQTSRPDPDRTVTSAGDLASLGDSIGPYKLLEVIGEGGFGEVWLAERREPMVQRVAIKIIKPGMDSKAVVARFEQERQALAVMDHPNVAKVLDGGVTPTGRPYFVMEYVKGEPITHCADRYRLTIKQRLELFIQVCEAVQHAHMKGILHRDIKPSNILVAVMADKQGEQRGSTPSMVVKVIDFGVSKAISNTLTDKTIFTERGQLIGTPEYMSPEQAEVGSTDIDTRTDVYSLGVVLYELLSGTLPFDTKTLRSAGYTEVQRIIREVDAPRPSTKLTTLDAQTGSAIAQSRQSERERITGELRRELEWIPMKALRKEPTRRYASAESLGADVRRYLDGKPLEAAPESRGYLVRKFVRRNRLQVTAAATVAVALIVGFGTALWQAREASMQRDAAILASEKESQQRVEAEAQRTRADERANAAEQAEKAEKLRADQLKRVGDFQSRMLGQIDTKTAGVRLKKDILERYAVALEREGVSEGERLRSVSALQDALARVNATDMAAAMIDRTILKPAIKSIDEQFKNDPNSDAGLRQSLATLYLSIGLYDSALTLQQSALETRRRTLGPDHPFTLSSLSNLGLLLFAQGKSSEAEPFYKEALEKSRKVLGDKDPKTLAAMGNMGVLLRAQGRFKEAELVSKEALDQRRAVLGEDHPDTLASINNMGGLLFSQGKLSEAEPYYREGLEKSRRVLGEEHPDTLVSIGNMGELLQALGRLDEAEPFLRDALEKRRRLLGEEHPDTLASINSMGKLLQAQGRPKEAEQFLRDALEKRRRLLGEAHPDTLVSINDVGFMLKSMNRLAEAEPYYREALEKSRRTLGDEHPETLVSISNMGALLQSQGKLPEAEQLLREALEKRRKTLGDDHPTTLVSISNMGALLRSQGRLADAEPLFREALEKSRRIRGDDHPSTLVSISNMGAVLQSQGKFSDAEPLFREVLDKSRRKNGEDHADTVSAISSLASVLASQEKFAEAEPLLREMLEKTRRTRGEDHADTIASISRLGSLLRAEGKLQEAEPLLREALQKRRRVLGDEHPDTLGSVAMMVRLKLAQGQVQEALDLATPFEAAARAKLASGNTRRLADFLAAIGRARVGVGYGAERSRLAEANLLEAHAILAAARDRGPKHKDTLECAQALVDLYTAWDKAEAGKGYDARAAEWKAKLDAAKE